jgi:hypothetical protein
MSAQKTDIPWFVLNSPELRKAFQNFYTACRSTGVLDPKTRELLITVLTYVFHETVKTGGRRCPVNAILINH